MDKRQAYIELKKDLADKDGVLCYCKQVTERKIRKTVRSGKRRFVSVKQFTDADLKISFVLWLWIFGIL